MSPQKGTKMNNLIKLYEKLFEAEGKYAEAATYSDSRKSIGAHKAAVTRARKKLIEACEAYLGSSDHQQVINLLTKLQGELK